MLNSNDLFAQIGFLVDPGQTSSPYRSRGRSQHIQNSFERSTKRKYVTINPTKKTIEQQFQQPQFITSLEIELSQNENHLLQIKSNDDPHDIAYSFCKKHNLNMLAVKVVQQKIIEAKQREEQKRKNNFQQNEINLFHKISNFNQPVPNNNCNQDFMKIKRRDASKSGTPSKLQNKRNRTKQKIQKTKDQNQKSQAQNQKLDKSQSKAILDKACQSLYLRGLQKTKVLQQKRLKRQQQLQKKQEQQLTFKPKINQVSEKIIEFRKQTGTVPPRHTSKVKQDLAEQFYKEIQECTFTPEINPISKIIVHNREAYRTENQHFNEFFNSNNSLDIQSSILYEKKPSNHQDQSMFNKKSKQYLLKQKELEQKELFKPKLNPKSIEKITEPFQVRLSKAIEIKQKIKEGEYMADQYTFQPQVNRSPYYQGSRGPNSRINKQNLPVWEQLYNQSQIRAKQRQKMSENKIQNQFTNASSGVNEIESLNHNCSKNSLTLSAKASSNLYYENLIQKRINNVFDLLDSDCDGIISPKNIGIESLSKNLLQMDEFNAELNYNQFRKAVINLLNDSDPYKKGLFLSDNSKKITNSYTFAPKINPKSKQLAEGRTTSQIHLDLYEQGVKNLKRKELVTEQEKARKQEKQLQQCSFKPCLHLGRKQYHPSILDKKISEMEFSVNQSSSQQESSFKRSPLNHGDDEQQ